MPWAKLDDHFWTHPRITEIGNAGAGIFARLISYCGCFLTDGVIPEQITGYIVASDRKAMDRLLEVGLVRRLESGGYYIPDYLDYNRDRATVEAEREAAKARQRVRRNGRQHA